MTTDRANAAFFKELSHPIILRSYRITGLQSKPIPYWASLLYGYLRNAIKTTNRVVEKFPKKVTWYPALIFTFEKNYWIPPRIIFLGAFWKRVFPFNSLSRTDTFGTHCISTINHLSCFQINPRHSRCAALNLARLILDLNLEVVLILEHYDTTRPPPCLPLLS